MKIHKFKKSSTAVGVIISVYIVSAALCILLDTTFDKITEEPKKELKKEYRDYTDDFYKQNARDFTRQIDSIDDRYTREIDSLNNIAIYNVKPLTASQRDSLIKDAYMRRDNAYAKAMACSFRKTPLSYDAFVVKLIKDMMKSK